MLPTLYEKPLSLHGMSFKEIQVNCSCRLPHSGSNTIDCMQLLDRCIPGRGVNVFKRYMHASVYPLGFCKFL